MILFNADRARFHLRRQCRAITVNSSRPQSLKDLNMVFIWILIASALLQHGAAQNSVETTSNSEEESESSDHSGYGWPTRIFGGAKELSECDGLGFPNSTRNACGFCTGGSTMLSSDYFKDCSGNCSGSNADRDCINNCKGTAYVDECSGECIGGNTRKSEKDVLSYRDCRGGCTSSGLLLITDSCGVCHTGVSPFTDCTNRCHLPGEEKMMAKLLCGRCVGGVTGIPESEVLDPCGNCRSEAVECPCNGTGTPDACGVCNGGGKSCMRVIRFQPRALPMNTQGYVKVEGAFRGRTGNVKCILVEVSRDGAGNRTEFSASVKEAEVSCLVKLKLGSYKIGVKIEVGDPAEEDYIEDSELLVYNKADYTTMTPTRAVFDRDGSPELVVTFSGSRVPRLPLICVISDEGWPSNKRLAPSDANTLDTCSIPNPNASVELTISPSFNGINIFKTMFKLKFYASPPDMKKYYIAEDGHAVVIVFDRPVNLCDLQQCAQILNNETLGRLGEGAQCKWATKQQLIITVQNPIKGDRFRVTFKKGILKQDGQKYALPKNDSLTIDAWYPQPVSSAQIAISGPATIPYCGIFTLVGHFSSPKGDAEFYWTAYRDDQRSLETIVSDALLEIRSATLDLSASLLEINMGYTFVLTAEQPGNAKYEARHKVAVVPYIGPLVTAYSNVLTQSSVMADERITLQAELAIPDCSTTTEYLHVMWSVSNPEVKFNFKSRSKHVYVIEPYSLPENSIVTFYANAYFGSMLNITKSQVQLRVEPLKLKAGIKGASKRVVGNRDGELILESDVLNRGFLVVYQWRCSEQDGLVCYNYNENSTEPLLIPRQLQNKARLKIPCKNLKAGKILTFELQIFNANNRNQYSQIASIAVVVQDKDIPQVFLESVLADGTDPVQRHPTTGAYDIPAGLPVTVLARITTAKFKIKSINWDIKGYSSPYTFTSKNGLTILSLEEGFLVGHGIYLIGLGSCDTKGACGLANLTIHAVPGIALCKLQIQPYVEYEMIQAKVIACSIPTDRQPVTYQLYLHSQASVFPLTVPQTSTIFSLVGPPKQFPNGTQISVQVCDKYMLCKLFPGPSIKVSTSENREEERERLVKKGALAVENRDLLPAMSMFLTVASDPNTELSTNEINDLLNAASNATSNRYINAGQLSLIYSSMFPLLRKDDNSVKMKAVDIIKRATKAAFANKVKVPTATLSQGYSNTAEALQCRNSDPALARKVKEAMEIFVNKISTTLPLGSKVLLASEYPGYPATVMFRQLLGSPIYLKAMSSNGLMEGSVKFEEAVREKIRIRKCSKQPQDCDGIVAAITLYPSQGPFSSSSKRTSPVLDVTLRKPEDGKPLVMSGVTNAIRMSMTHSGNTSDAQSKGIMYRCSYWDEGLKDWSAEGIVTYGVEGRFMRCWSSHLTAFAVVEVYDGLSTGAIVGIVVTVLMGVFIIMMFAFFFFRKKQVSNTRVSHETLPKRDKLQSVNGSSIVKVKTITP